MQNSLEEDDSHGHQHLHARVILCLQHHQQKREHERLQEDDTAPVVAAVAVLLVHRAILQLNLQHERPTVVWLVCGHLLSTTKAVNTPRQMYALVGLWCDSPTILLSHDETTAQSDCHMFQSMVLHGSPLGPLVVIAHQVCRG